MKDQQKTPYQVLGASLRLMRIKFKESLAEVSGAVEIDQEVLRKIERGEQCPSEDILLLLISHFDIEEDEATRLWELAGYDKQKSDKQIVMVMPMESTRVMYTDKVEVTVNNYGVVLNFLQNLSGGKQSVARLGMSREHAGKVLQVLQDTLAQADRPATHKLLPAPKQTETDKN